MAARYDAVAAGYAAGADDLSGSALTALLELVGEVTDRSILDLACGHGLVARELARGGARVVGVDLSAEMVERARAIERESAWGVVYECGDAGDGGLLPDASFDLCVCNFGLSDIDDLDGACATVTRVLRPGGRFVFSILHPCFSGADDVSGSWPSDGSYYDERWWQADGARSTLRAVVGANHRTLSTYVAALVGHGLQVEAMAEPRPEAEWTTERPTAAGLPVYLVVVCRRVGGD